MTRRKPHNKAACLCITAVVSATAFFSCLSHAEQAPVSSAAHARHEQFITGILPQIVSQLEPGDIIFRMGNDITSLMFASINEKDKRFSHCGVASLEDGSWFVYHAIGGEFNPDQALVREPLSSFADERVARRIGLFHPQVPAEARKKTIAIVRGWHAMEIPFDMAFDWQSNDKMYCAEMVAKALIAGTDKAASFSFSKQGEFRYLSIENLMTSPVLTEKAVWQY